MFADSAQTDLTFSQIILDKFVLLEKDLRAEELTGGSCSSFKAEL